MYVVFGFPTGTHESNIRILDSDTPVSIPLKQYKCTYLQPAYPLGTRKKFEGMASSKLAKVYESNYLLYATVDDSLVMYELDMLNRCTKGGDFDDETLIQVGSTIQAIEFFAKTFKNNRICILTADGRLVKIVLTNKTATVKRNASIPDQIDNDILFTDMSICDDKVLVSGYHLAKQFCLLVVMGRNLEVISRCILEDQGSFMIIYLDSHIHMLKSFELKSKTFTIAGHYLGCLSIFCVDDKNNTHVVESGYRVSTGRMQ